MGQAVRPPSLDRIEKEYNKRLRNSHNGAGNKPARIVVGALIVRHVQKLSDEKTIQAIQENPYMQYLLGLEKCTEKPVFVPEFFVFGNYRLLIGEFYLNLQRRDNAIREKLDQTADTWIEVGFFAKNIMKFLRGLLCLIFEKSDLKTFQK